MAQNNLWRQGREALAPATVQVVGNWQLRTPRQSWAADSSKGSGSLRRICELNRNAPDPFFLVLFVCLIVSACLCFIGRRMLVADPAALVYPLSFSLCAQPLKTMRCFQTAISWYMASF